MKTAVEQVDRNLQIIKRHLTGENHASIGRDYDISRERVRQIVASKLGDSSPEKFRQVAKRQAALQAFAMLELGWPESVAGNKADLLFLQTSLGENKGQRRFRHWLFRQVGSTHGHLSVLDIEPLAPECLAKSSCRVTLRCGLCSKVYETGYRHVLCGKSTMCHSCRCRGISRDRGVIDTSTGLHYASITSAGRKLELNTRQELRYFRTGDSRARFVAEV